MGVEKVNQEVIALINVKSDGVFDMVATMKLREV